MIARSQNKSLPRVLRGAASVRVGPGVAAIAPQHETQAAAVAVYEVAALGRVGFALVGDLAVDHALVDPDPAAPSCGSFQPMALSIYDLRSSHFSGGHGPRLRIAFADLVGKTQGKTAVRSGAEVFGTVRMLHTEAAQARGLYKSLFFGLPHDETSMSRTIVQDIGAILPDMEP